MSPKPLTAERTNGRPLSTPREVAQRTAIVRQARRWYLACAGTASRGRRHGVVS